MAPEIGKQPWNLTHRLSFFFRSFIKVPYRSTDLVSQLFTDQRLLRAAVRKARKNWNSIVKEVVLFTFFFINAIGVFSVWTREGNISLTLLDDPFWFAPFGLEWKKDWQLKTAFGYWYSTVFIALKGTRCCIMMLEGTVAEDLSKNRKPTAPHIFISIVMIRFSALVPIIVPFLLSTPSFEFFLIRAPILVSAPTE